MKRRNSISPAPHSPETSHSAGKKHRWRPSHAVRIAGGVGFKSSCLLFGSIDDRRFREEPLVHASPVSSAGGFLCFGLRSILGAITWPGFTVPTRSRAMARTSLRALNGFDFFRTRLFSRTLIFREQTFHRGDEFFFVPLVKRPAARAREAGVDQLHQSVASHEESSRP